MSIPKNLRIKEKAEIVSSSTLPTLLRLEKDPKRAFQLFLKPNPYHAKLNRFRYSQFSYNIIISKLGRAKMFEQMETIMRKLKSDTLIFPKEVVFCNIIRYYTRARLINKAHQVFDEMPKFRCGSTIKSFNSLLNGYLDMKEFGVMNELLDNVRRYGDPDVGTFNVLMNACFVRGVLDERWWGMLVEMVRGGLQLNGASFSTLIMWLCRVSKLEEARELESIMVRDYGFTPNIVIHGALIKGLCGAGKVDEALERKEEVIGKGFKLHSTIYTALISALFKDGRKWEAGKLLKEMEQNGCRVDTITYNAMISCCCIRKEFDAAFHLVNEMEKKGPQPNVISYNIIIRGLCGEGKLFDAIGLFEDMPNRKCIPDVVTYRVLLDGLREGYMFEKAVEVLDEMVGKGCLPWSESVNKLVDGLIRKQKVELLWKVLYSLGKVNGIDFDVWRSAVSVVCGQALFSYSSALEIVDSLVMTAESKSQRLMGENQTRYD